MDASVSSWSWLWAPIATAVGGLIWGVRLEGRVNAHDQRFDLERDQADERHADIKERLVRIEQKLDQKNRKGE